MDKSKKQIFAEGLASLSAILGMLAMVVCLLWQCYVYARHGFWFPLTALDVLGMMFNVTWLTNPEDWLGVHRFLSFLNGGVFAFGLITLAGVSVAVLIAGEN